MHTTEAPGTRSVLRHVKPQRVRPRPLPQASKRQSLNIVYTVKMESWKPKGSFKEKTLKQLQNELPSTFGGSIRFTLTSPGLIATFDVSSEATFAFFKRKIVEIARRILKKNRDAEFNLDIQRLVM